MNSSPPPSPFSGGMSPSRALAGRYTFLKKLGSGSFGTVYLVRDAVRECRAALKVIRTDRITDRAVSSMQDEFRAITSLNHPHIATAYDFGYTEGGLPFYTREYVSGDPLPPGPPGTDRPRGYLRPILDLLHALAYLHDNGILHLDVHAGNLILADDPDQRGVLIDFGLVRSPGATPYSLSHASLPGLPPELMKGGPASPRTDVFMAGRLLQYRLTGRAEGEARAHHGQGRANTSGLQVSFGPGIL